MLSNSVRNLMVNFFWDTYLVQLIEQPILQTPNFNFPNFKNSSVSVECDQTPGSTIPPLLSRTENLDTVCVDWLFCSEDGAQKTTQN